MNSDTRDEIEHWHACSVPLPRRRKSMAERWKAYEKEMARQLAIDERMNAGSRWAIEWEAMKLRGRG